MYKTMDEQREAEKFCSENILANITMLMQDLQQVGCKNCGEIYSDWLQDRIEGELFVDYSGFYVKNDDSSEYEDGYDDDDDSSGYEDDRYVEVLEFYSVSNKFANLLKAEGQVIIKLYNFHVWCRTISGQAIVMDEVIQKIHSSIVA